MDTCPDPITASRDQQCHWRTVNKSISEKDRAMIKNLLANWKTTSAGMLMIVTAIVHLIFSIKHGTADESAWISGMAAILGGIGLLAAGDASKSKADTIAVDAKVDQTASAVMSHDTTLLPKPSPKDINL